MRVRALALALTVLVLSACGLPDSRLTSTTFDGNKKAILFAAYSINAGAITLEGFADVPVGTPGVIEMTGPFHMLCHGQFVPMDPNHPSPDNLPELDVGEGTVGANLHSPAGSYTAILSIADKHVELRKSFQAGHSPPDPQTGVYEVPLECAAVADTQQQWHDLLPRYASALRFWVARLDETTTKAELLRLSGEVESAIADAGYPAALEKATQMSSITEARPLLTPEYRVRQDLNEVLALLQQPPPSS